MTGISKNFFKFSSIMAVVALFLGLMVTGCSEGDSNPAHVDYDTDGAGIDIIVGLADPVAPKGFDVDNNANHFVVSLLDSANELVGDYIPYAAEAGEGVQAWDVLDDGALRLSRDVAAEDVDKVASVLIVAFDKEDSAIGAIVNDNVNLTAGKTTVVDFTADDAPAYMSAPEILGKTTMTVTTNPEAKDGVVTLAVGEKAEVGAYLTYKFTDKVTFVEVLDDEDVCTLSCDSENIKIDGKTIEGISATAEDATLTVTCIEGAYTVSADVKVKVTGDEPGPGPEPSCKYAELKIYIDVPVEGIDDATWEEMATDFYLPSGAIFPMYVYGKIVNGETATYEKVNDVTLSMKDASPKFLLDGKELSVPINAVYGDKGTLSATYVEGEATMTAECTFHALKELVSSPDNLYPIRLNVDGTVTVGVTGDGEPLQVELSCDNDPEEYLNLSHNTIKVIKVDEDVARYFIVMASVYDPEGIFITKYTYDVIVS